MTATYLTAQPLMARARAWEDRNPPEHRGSFRKTLWHAEATAYRSIIAKAKVLDRSQRERLTKMVNLWFRNRLDGALTHGNARLANLMGVVANTFRTFIRWAIGKGFVSVVSGGVGRGNKTVYVVNLGVIQDVLAPNMTVSSGSERVTIEGEIDVAEKVQSVVSHYIEPHRGRSSFTSFPFRWLRKSERLWLGRRQDTAFLTALIRRLRENRSGIAIAGTRCCPAKPKLNLEGYEQ